MLLVKLEVLCEDEAPERVDCDWLRCFRSLFSFSRLTLSRLDAASAQVSTVIIESGHQGESRNERCEIPLKALPLSQSLSSNNNFHFSRTVWLR